MDGLLRVANAGPAMPQDLLARLLNPFERGRAQAQSAGLGLPPATSIHSPTK
jgi:two-component system OmpR family sensor kinase